MTRHFCDICKKEDPECEIFTTFHSPRRFFLEICRECISKFTRPNSSTDVEDR